MTLWDTDERGPHFREGKSYPKNHVRPLGTAEGEQCDAWYGARDGIRYRCTRPKGHKPNHSHAIPASEGIKPVVIWSDRKDDDFWKELGL